MLNRSILLIDDCIEIGALVRKALEPYALTQAFSMRDAEEKIKSGEFALVIIDIGLPDGNGIDFCQMLMSSERHKRTPKILLTAESQDSTKIYGLYCGADDYVVKPFSGPELKARVDARLRHLEDGHRISIAGLELDLESLKVCDVRFGRKDLDLTPTEFRILHLLVKNQRTALTREEIVRKIWINHEAHISSRGVDSHICRLRKKLPEDCVVIESVYTRGYCLKVISQLKAAA
ncbi:MAG: response regulator transcription factor [Bdellovibrionaceae bacterium]|nr:response regulator transcription factor [Pseudobdellovibrionaceae bacterium]